METSSTRIDAYAPPPGGGLSANPSLGQQMFTQHDEEPQAALPPDVLEHVAGGIEETKLPVFGGGGGFSGGGSGDSW